MSKANGTNPSCIITDMIKTNVKEYKLCSGRGSCDTGSGLCDCYNNFVGVNCGKLTSQVDTETNNDVILLHATAGAFR